MRMKSATGGALATVFCGLLTAFAASPASAHCGDAHLSTPDRYSAGGIAVSIPSALLTHPHNNCGGISGSASPGQAIDVHCRAVTGTTFIHIYVLPSGDKGWIEASKLSGPTSAVPLC
jgi:hypothetical protein